MRTLFRFIQILFFGTLCFGVPINSAMADAEADIAFLVNAKQPPTGVVFEVVEGDAQVWESVAGQIGDFIARLKQASPTMKFAVVSHGREEFALLSENQTQQPRLHAAIKNLVAQNVPVQVCGTHAGWQDKTRKDFPAYVDVVDAGPAQILQYQRQGYALVRVRPASKPSPATRQ